MKTLSNLFLWSPLIVDVPLLIRTPSGLHKSMVLLVHQTMQLPCDCYITHPSLMSLLSSQNKCDVGNIVTMGA